SGQADRYCKLCRLARRNEHIFEINMKYAGVCICTRVELKNANALLPSLYSLTNIMDGKSRSRVVVRRKYEPVEVTAVIGPHHTLTRGGGQQQQNGLPHRGLFRNHGDVTSWRKLQSEFARRYIEIRMLKLPGSVSSLFHSTSVTNC